MNSEEIKNFVKERLSEKRFLHTTGVAEEAKRLALRWGYDPEKAYLAGIIHDCCKEVPYNAALEELNAFGYVPDEEMKSCPALLHGPLAAYTMREILKIDDEDMFNAVWYHSTGRENMSLLEKIIYMADFIEPMRSFEDVDKVRKLAYENLDRAALMEADMVIIFTVERGKHLHTDTIRARNDLLRRVDK